MARWPKRCACGACYWPAAWSALPFVGHLDVCDDELIELRNCRCGSTIAVEGQASPSRVGARALATCARSESLRGRVQALLPKLVVFTECKPRR